MPEISTQPSKRLLDPIDRYSEILFGLIMVLTFTGSLSASASGRDEIRTMLIGAIGCNLAWGIIDAVMYLMACFGERGRGLLALRAVREATDPHQAHRVIADALPPVVASVLREPELETIRTRLNQLSGVPERPRLGREEFRGAIGVFLLVFLSTFPVVIPFLFMRDALLALRISNGIAIGMLFVLGFLLGRHAGHHPWRVGISMVLIGVMLVGITVALGG